MIRINLLPVRHEIKRQFGKQQLLLGLLLIGIEVAVLFAIYNSYRSKLDDVDSRATAIQAEVEELNEQARTLATLNEQKSDLEGLSNVLARLESNRSGPVAVMDELKEMLNPPANDLQRVAQQRRNWDTTWDPRSVWLTRFDENGGSVSIAGKAMSNDDVAEFTVRLASSTYFSDVRLIRTRADSAGALGAVFTFDITADVSYGDSADEDEEG